jgi:flagellar biosynthesis protein FliR
MNNPFIFTLSQFEGFLLIFMRVTGMLFASPLFGGTAVPTQVRVFLSMMLALVLLPIPIPEKRLVQGCLPGFVMLNLLPKSCRKQDFMPKGW